MYFFIAGRVWLLVPVTDCLKKTLLLNDKLFIDRNMKFIQCDEFLQ